jgi:hypothetical protein
MNLSFGSSTDQRSQGRLDFAVAVGEPKLAHGAQRTRRADRYALGGSAARDIHRRPVEFVPIPRFREARELSREAYVRAEGIDFDHSEIARST